MSRLCADQFQGIITGIDERRAQEQVFCRIATQRELGRQQQLRALGMGLVRSIYDFSGIAHHVTHHKIELGHTNFERHEIGRLGKKRGVRSGTQLTG